MKKLLVSLSILFSGMSFANAVAPLPVPGTPTAPAPAPTAPAPAPTAPIPASPTYMCVSGDGTAGVLVKPSDLKAVIVKYKGRGPSYNLVCHKGQGRVILSCEGADTRTFNLIEGKEGLRGQYIGSIRTTNFECKETSWFGNPAL